MDIEAKILAKWEDAKEALLEKQYLDRGDLDEHFKLILKGYQETIKGNTELENLIANKM